MDGASFTRPDLGVIGKRVSKNANGNPGVLESPIPEDGEKLVASPFPEPWDALGQEQKCSYSALFWEMTFPYYQYMALPSYVL